MKKCILILLTVCLYLGASAQKMDFKKIQPDSSTYDNIYVKKVSEDKHQSTFIIWIKTGVKAHYHKNHTEYVAVISGKGSMVLGDKTFIVKKGDSVLIPKGSPHSVTTLSRKPLKVISIQTPKFDGDRIWVK